MRLIITIFLLFGPLQVDSRKFVPLSINTLNVNRRDGPAPKKSLCDKILKMSKSASNEFNFPDVKLSKLVYAYGIPIVATSNVLDEAMYRACYVAAFMFADRKDTRDMFYSGKGFIHVIGYRETPGRPATKCMMTGWWKGYKNCRALPPTEQHPYVVVSEENLLCARTWFMTDRFEREDLLVHELAHAITRLLYKKDREFIHISHARLKSATMHGLWKGTYASWGVDEYLAEGAQSFFSVNAEKSKYHRKHNHINLREELRDYDPNLFDLMRKVFPCSSEFIPKCKQQSHEVQQAVDNLVMDCDPNDPEPICEDHNGNCEKWAKSGECEFNQMYMKTQCRNSCNTCHSNEFLGCKDNDDRCELWALAGQCKENPGYMIVNCSRSCGSCKDQVDTPDCADFGPQCEGWEVLGYCDKGSAYMNFQCQKSCRRCPSRIRRSVNHSVRMWPHSLSIWLNKLFQRNS